MPPRVGSRPDRRHLFDGAAPRRCNNRMHISVTVDHEWSRITPIIAIASDPSSSHPRRHADRTGLVSLTPETVLKHMTHPGPSRTRGQAIVIFAAGLIAIVSVSDWSSMSASHGPSSATSRTAQTLRPAQVRSSWRASGRCPLQRQDQARRLECGPVHGWHERCPSTRAPYTDWQGIDLTGTDADPWTTDGGSSRCPAVIPPESAPGDCRKQGTFLIRVSASTNGTSPGPRPCRSDAGCLETGDGCTFCRSRSRSPYSLARTRSSRRSIPPGLDGGAAVRLADLRREPRQCRLARLDAAGWRFKRLTDIIPNPPDRFSPAALWQYVTQTGDICAAPVEDALNEYAGETVLLPFFDSTCNVEPTNTEVERVCDVGVGGPAPTSGTTSRSSCRSSSPNQGAFVNGNNTWRAESRTRRNVKGTFVTFITEGPVGPPCPPGDARSAAPSRYSSSSNCESPGEGRAASWGARLF